MGGAAPGGAVRLEDGWRWIPRRHLVLARMGQAPAPRIEASDGITMRDRQGQCGAEQVGPGASCLSPPSFQLLPGASRAGPEQECAEAAFGTHLDHHTILGLCINNHSITCVPEHESLGTNFEPGSRDADMKHFKQLTKPQT